MKPNPRTIARIKLFLYMIKHCRKKYRSVIAYDVIGAAKTGGKLVKVFYRIKA